MTFHKALLSRFSDTQILVSGQHQTELEGCLSALSGHERVGELLEATTLASDEYWLPETDWRSDYQPYVVRDGILQIPVRGVLLHNFPWQLGSWATGYQYVWEAYKRGLSDGNVRAVALTIHSPGGEVAGNFDLVDRMYERRGEKPLRAFAHEYAYSAAYSIASVADHIAMSRTGGVGSIGVVTSHVDVSKMMDDFGWKVTFIFSGKHKVDGNPYEPLPDGVKAKIQARVDDLRQTFASTVARNRGMDVEAVLATEADIYYATEAQSIGLADSVGSFEDAVAAFAAELSVEEGDEQMSDKDNAAADKAAIDEARAAGVEQGKQEGMEAGATAERERIASILTCAEAEGRESAAIELALDTDTKFSAVSAAKVLARMPKAEAASESTDEGEATGTDTATGQNFDEAMSKDNPDVGASGEGDDEEEDVVAVAGKFGLMGFSQRKTA